MYHNLQCTDNCIYNCNLRLNHATIYFIQLYLLIFCGRRSTTGFAPRSIRCALLIFFCFYETTNLLIINIINTII